MATKITFALVDEDIERLHHATELTGISQAKLISCLLAIDDAMMVGIVAQNLTKISEEKRAHRQVALQQRQAATEVVKQLSPEQINAILAAVANKGV